MPNIYNLVYFGLASKFACSLSDDRVKAESKRISKIWKQMLGNKKTATELGMENA